MKALLLVPGTTTLRLVDRPEPVIAAPDEVKLQVLQVGICGTDREEASGGRAEAPPDQDELIIGHEMLGRVVETGSAVKSMRSGDYAVFTVRRGCGHCTACAVHRSDMCYSGDHADRGIRKRDGYQAEYVVDAERYVMKVPSEMATIGVLSEPMSIAEKAIDEALLVQLNRLPDAGPPERWLIDRQVLVAGLGPIGILAAVALRLRGANVLGLDVVDANTPRSNLLTQIGGKYVDGRRVEPATVDLDAFSGARSLKDCRRPSQHLSDCRQLADKLHDVGQHRGGCSSIVGLAFSDGQRAAYPPGALSLPRVRPYQSRQIILWTPSQRGSRRMMGMKGTKNSTRKNPVMIAPTWRSALPDEEKGCI